MLHHPIFCFPEKVFHLNVSVSDYNSHSGLEYITITNNTNLIVFLKHKSLTTVVTLADGVFLTLFVKITSSGWRQNSELRTGSKCCSWKWGTSLLLTFHWPNKVTQLYLISKQCRSVIFKSTYRGYCRELWYLGRTLVIPAVTKLYEGVEKNKHLQLKVSVILGGTE